MGSPARPASILVSCALSDHGGNETHVQALCALLRAAGHEVTIATRSRGFARAHGRRMSDLGVRVVTTPFDSSAPAAIRNLWAAAVWPIFPLRRNYTHLIAIGPGGFNRLMVGRLIPGGTSLYWEAGDGLSTYVPTHLRMLRAMDGLSATSRPVAERMSAALGRPVEVLPPLTPIPPAEAAPVYRLSETRVQVGFIGRVSRLKGVDVLLRAWSALRIDADLHLFGDGREAVEMVALAESLGVADDVRFHGPFDRESDLARVMAGLDLLVLPSLSEGLPHVLIEALAYGLPFVATDVGGVSDLSDGNPGATLVEPTPESVGSGLREAIRQLRAGEVRREEILAFYRERFSPEVAGPRWLAALGLAQDPAQAAAPPAVVVTW